MWALIKNFCQRQYYLAYVYGKLRSYAQPLISTEFNIHEIEPNVFIGDFASAANDDELKKYGITHIIVAVLGAHPQFPESFVYMTVPLRDVDEEDILQHLPQTTNFINDAVRSGGKVLVHCVCGVSRSATIVAAWIMMNKEKDEVETEAIINEMKTKRECINPILSFRDQLETFKKNSITRNL